MADNELFGISEQLENEKDHFANPGNMVGDLISRRAAIDEIKALYEWHDMPTEDRMIQHFKVLPPAQQERKKGKWLPDNNNYYEERFICSVCGKSYKVDTCMGKPMWDFCPCGADMRGEQDG